MHPLSCAFPDKIRFYDQVMKQAEHRLFVSTEEELAVGDEVDVDITFQSNTQPLRTRAKVLGKRAKGQPGQEPGVWLQILPAQLETLRQMMHIDDGEGAFITARASPRFDCALPLLVEKPIRQPFRSRNISSGGVCIAGIVPVPVGQTLRLAVELPTQTITVFGKVVWRRDEAHLTGVEFRFQSDDIRKAMSEAVRRIGDEQSLIVHAKPTVLLVDDDLGTLRALERVLSFRGYGTLTAASGPEALSVAREHRPALILLDVLLPGMNGLEVCRVLKRDVGTSAIPVVLTSVLPKDNLSLLLNDSGALMALPKPYRFETLSGVVEQVLDSSRSMQPGGGPPDEERRDSKRVPLFERCTYESGSLRVESWLREASEQGAFLLSCWGEPLGTLAKLSLMRNLDEPFELEVEVVNRIGWGIADGTAPQSPPGLGLRFCGGTSQKEFNEWLFDYRSALENRPIILIVDDDRSHLELLGLILRKAGYGVVTLDSPSGVANAIALAKPSLVILDYMLPGIDGVTLCRNIKNDPATREVPVWLYSSVTDEHLEALARDAQADGHLQKGARPSDVAESIGRFLKDKQAT